MLYVLSFEVNIVLRLFFEFFNFGRSVWKGLFFFGWTILLFLGLLLFPRAQDRKWAPRALWCSIGLVSLFSLLAHFYLCKHLGVPVLSYVLYSSNGELSSSQLTHLHIGKGVLSLALETTKTILPLPGDAGVPFAGIISPFLLWGIGIFTILSFALSAPIFVARAWKTSAPERLPLLVLYPLCSFPILKSLIDGGPLCAESLAALFFFLPLTFGISFFEIFPAALSRKTQIFLFLIIVVGLIFIVLDWGTLLPGYRYFRYFRDFFRDLFFFSSLLFATMTKVRPSGTHRGLALLTLGMALFLARGSNWSFEAAQLNAPIDVGDQVVICADRLADLGLPKRGEMGGFIRHKFVAREKMRGLDLYEMFRVQQSYDIFRIVGKGCQLFEPRKIISRVILLDSATLPQLTPNEIVTSALSSELPPSGAGLANLQVEINTEGCLPGKPQMLVAAYLTSKGMRNFALIGDN